MKAIKLYTFFILVVLVSCAKRSKYEVEYYDNGDTLSIYELTDNVRDGKYQLFYKGKQLKEEGYYEGNQFVGTRKLYYENGKMREYYYYEYGEPLYYKKFDKEGYIVGNGLGFKSHMNSYTNELDLGDSLLVDYELVHSMFDSVGLLLIVTNIETGDTLATEISDTTLISKHLRPTIEGVNQYRISLYETLHNKHQLVGSYTDTLKINVLSDKKKV